MAHEIFVSHSNIIERVPSQVRLYFWVVQASNEVSMPRRWISTDVEIIRNDMAKPFPNAVASKFQEAWSSLTYSVFLLKALGCLSGVNSVNVETLIQEGWRINRRSEFGIKYC